MTDTRAKPSGSLLIAWQLENKEVAIVGGGEVACQRIESLLSTAVQTIHLIAPFSGLNPRTAQLVGQHADRIIHIDTDFAFRTTPQQGDVRSDGGLAANVDLFAFDMVLTALDDTELSRRIVHACRSRRIPVNAADIPDLCDFYFGGQVRDGPLQIMISTNGNGPKLAALIKEKIRSSLTGYEGEALTRVGVLRNKLKERAPGVGGEVGKRRMKWMSGICQQWTMKELASLDDETIEWMLNEGWEKGKVVQPARTFQRVISLLAKAALGTIGILVLRRTLLSYYFRRQ
ncbi:siroheme biosynthesis protein MET8 [Coprinopsis sp. MPI-PUGE-AT-0042]|nr:siroheme biosynthesis protein MET8 [Coprinopsis sp. MPI-PUGE-AT-0042]